MLKKRHLSVFLTLLSFFIFKHNLIAQNCGIVSGFSYTVSTNSNGTYKFTFDLTTNSTSGGTKSVNITIKSEDTTFISNQCLTASSAGDTHTLIVDTILNYTSCPQLEWTGSTNNSCGGTTCSTGTISYAQTIYVNVDATGTNTGSSWTNAYTDLQDALDASMSSIGIDTILIAEGTYYPTHSPDDNTTNARDRAFHLADSNVLISGGYDASSAMQIGCATILSGDLITAGAASDSAHHVFITTSLDSTSLIENILITAGKADSSGNITYHSKVFNRASGGGMNNSYSSPSLTNCLFVCNSASSFGGGMYNSSSSSPTIVNCAFKNNLANSGGGMYNYTSSPTLTNTYFFKNLTDNNGNSIYNDSSSLNSNSTHNASDADLGIFPNTKVDLSDASYKDLFVDSTNFEGTDGVWGTKDDGLQLLEGTVLIGAGTSTGAPTLDIIGEDRPSTPSIGPYEGSYCNSSNALPTGTNTTYTSTYKSINLNGWTNYCDDNDKLLLSLKIGSSGAVINADEVELKLGSSTTFSSTSSGGLITNTAGYAMIDRRWNVAATTQPNNGNVGVRYYFTDSEYDDVVTALGNLASKSTIDTVTQLNMFKAQSNVSGGGAPTAFADPHTVNGIVLANGTTPSTTVWKAGTHGSADHIAEFEVSSFSGGGGGGGGGGGTGAAPLPVELIHFTATPLPNHNAKLVWATASEINNSHFVIERSYDGKAFEAIGIVEGNGNSNEVLVYNYLDHTIEANQNTVYYRLHQFDFDGEAEYTGVRRVDFSLDLNLDLINVYPNPFRNEVFIATNNLETDSYILTVTSMNGTEVMKLEVNDNLDLQKLDMSDLRTGVYILNITTAASSQNYRIIKN
jgi:hypothetical protein